MTNKTEQSIYVSRDIAAPAGPIFSLLARPGAHPDVDGSGMVRMAEDDIVLNKVGDVFRMKMFNDEMGDYVIENAVVEFEPDRRIVWEPVMLSIDMPEFQSAIGDPAHHQWGWQLEPLDVDRTRVTEFFDCSRSPEWLQKVVKGGERWRPEIEASLKNLERLVAESQSAAASD